MTIFDLEAFRAKRDAAKRHFRRWDVSIHEINAAHAAGERDFIYANLESANLESANLESANLESANLYNANLESANLESANLYNASLYNANLESANLESANLYNANLYNANLESANLYNANLYNANLINANLYNANLINAAGIYVAYAPNLSSRGAALLGGLTVDDGKVQLRFWAGCKRNITEKQLLEFVKETHDDNIHAKQYKAAITFIKACFKIDMAAGKWDYLIDLQAKTEEQIS